MRQIVLYPNDILTKSCNEVKEFNQFLFDLLDDMNRIMTELNGLGIAAPQVGESLRVIIIKSEKGIVTELVNPKILNVTGGVMLNEGCLSVPGHFLSIARPEVVTIGYQDRNGEPHSGVCYGNEARALLHEMDHLDGKMFFSKVSRQQRKYLLKLIEKSKK